MTDLYRLLLSPAVEIVKAICAKDYSAVEVVEERLSRIESINPKPCTVRLAGERALKEAYIVLPDLGYR